MRKSKLLYALGAGLIGFLFGGVLVTVASRWCDFAPDFYSVRLVEIFQLALPVILAIFITYLVNCKLNNDAKRRELIIGLIDAVQKKLDDVYMLGSQYLLKRDKELERQITLGLKDAAVMLTIFGDILKAKVLVLEGDAPNIVGDFLAFKISLTDTPFGRSKEQFSPEREKEIREKYAGLVTKLYECRLQMYS